MKHEGFKPDNFTYASVLAVLALVVDDEKQSRKQNARGQHSADADDTDAEVKVIGLEPIGSREILKGTEHEIREHIQEDGS
ncbi:unnamed protein product [Arabidopsis halleri]